jgi:putative hemolysin
MIHNIFEFSETPAKDVMIPRTDIVAVSLETGFDELAVIIREEQFSRIPVYEGSVDSIVGVIYVKDLFGLTDADRASFQVRNYLRDAYFIPEMKRIGNLFEEMRALKIHMAVVLDEYGGTAGLVTIEDLVEEIVGDISDEYDQEIAPLFINVDENTASIDASMRIDELNEMMDLAISDDDADTIGGFVLSRMERIPEEGERFEWHNMEFIIDQMDGRRIMRITIVKKPEE